jgi:hypothetical protein
VEDEPVAGIVFDELAWREMMLEIDDHCGLPDVAADFIRSQPVRLVHERQTDRSPQRRTTGALSRSRLNCAVICLTALSEPSDALDLRQLHAN